MPYSDVHRKLLEWLVAIKLLQPNSYREITHFGKLNTAVVCQSVCLIVCRIAQAPHNYETINNLDEICALVFLRAFFLGLFCMFYFYLCVFHLKG